jgi:hypothetical protein
MSGPARTNPSAEDAGSLTDADLTREMAQLAALRDRQRVGGESPSPSNPTPLTLLSLFSLFSHA